MNILRHTFCSHLTMRGAPARAIQELAGHADLTTTQRYMHLSPAATEDAIRLLDGPAKAGHNASGGSGELAEKFGDIFGHAIVDNGKWLRSEGLVERATGIELS